MRFSILLYVFLSFFLSVSKARPCLYPQHGWLLTQSSGATITCSTCIHPYTFTCVGRSGFEIQTSDGSLILPGCGCTFRGKEKTDDDATGEKRNTKKEDCVQKPEGRNRVPCHAMACYVQLRHGTRMNSAGRRTTRKEIEEKRREKKRK